MTILYSYLLIDQSNFKFTSNDTYHFSTDVNYELFPSAAYQNLDLMIMNASCFITVITSYAPSNKAYIAVFDVSLVKVTISEITYV